MESCLKILDNNLPDVSLSFDSFENVAFSVSLKFCLV